MNKVEIINFLEKYKKICAILNLTEDMHSFDKLISFIEINEKNNGIEKSSSKTNAEKDFIKIISDEVVDLSKYNISNGIIENKMNILNYWIGLDNNIKEKFNTLELNYIMYLLTKKSDCYLKKEKRKIIFDIDMTVRNKRTADSYNNIKM
jgi:hypothetical protein